MNLAGLHIASEIESSLSSISVPSSEEEVPPGGRERGRVGVVIVADAGNTGTVSVRTPDGAEIVSLAAGDELVIPTQAALRWVASGAGQEARVVRLYA